MKLIGSYTSPFVRKIAIILLEKGLDFEFVNEAPYADQQRVMQYNPLGKIPALVTPDGEHWFDSPVIAQYLELLGKDPALVPVDALAALRLRQTEALADGIMDAALTSVRERARPVEQQSEAELLRQREKISTALDWLERSAANGTLSAQPLTIASIAVGCAIGYLNFRRVAPGWCAKRPHLVRVVDELFQRESFARTEPPVT